MFLASVWTVAQEKHFILVTMLLCHILLIMFHLFFCNDIENLKVTLKDSGLYLFKISAINAVLL